MKALSSLCVLLAASLSVSFGQNFSFGVRGGLNAASLAITLPPNLWPAGNQKEPRISFNAGVYSQYSINDKIAVQAELFYSGEGCNFTDPGTELPAHLELAYLGLPVFFKYAIIRNLYAMAGPQFSYLLSAKSIYTDGDTYDVLSEHNRIAVSVVPSLGYDWKNVSFSLRYSIGLTKLPNSNPYWRYTPYADDNVKSNVLSVVVAYKIFN